MYIIKNAWTNITRNKGRNILIGLIITVITISACISLSINKSGSKLVESYKTSNPTEITFNLDMMQLRNDRNSNSDLTIDTLTEEDIKNYGDSKYVKDYYYSFKVSLSSNDIDAIDFSEIFTKEDDEGNDNKQFGNNEESKGHDKVMEQGDFKFVAYSDVSYIENFINGDNKITEGKMIDNESEENEIIISSALASSNELELGDKITFYNPSDEDDTYEFEIVGIYEDNSTSNDDNFMNMNAMNSENQIYTTITAIKNVLEDVNTTNNIEAKYYLNSSNDIDAFEKEVRKKGLSEYYTLNDNLDSILETLNPISNISNFSMTLLIIILTVGGIVLIIINMINIRDRKYEIGVLRAIGMNKVKVCLELISEIFMIAIISLVIGTVIGYTTSQPITNKMLASEINSIKEEQNNTKENFGGDGMMRKAFTKQDQNENIDYVDELKVNIDIVTIIQLFGVSLILTVLSGSVTILSINKYEPNKILQNRI